MNVNEYIKVNFETKNISNNSSCTTSSINNSLNSTTSSSSSDNSSISYDDENRSYHSSSSSSASSSSSSSIISNSFNESLSFNRHDYYKLELLKTNIDNLNLNLLLNEIKCEMNNLIDKIKLDLTIDIQTKMTELVYEQTLLNAKFAALQCCLTNNEFNEMVGFFTLLK